MADASDWDFEAQKAGTALTLQDLAEKGLPEGLPIRLDLQFLPGEGADMTAFLKALGMFGYEAEGSAEDGEVEATVDAELSLDSIWTHEERATKIALSRGYVPDGWGFWDPEGED
ncbi:MAG: hypothetical protein AAF192_09065 [Pseudomonadota bacterium]